MEVPLSFCGSDKTTDPLMLVMKENYSFIIVEHILLSDQKGKRNTKYLLEFTSDAGSYSWRALCAKSVFTNH